MDRTSFISGSRSARGGEEQRSACWEPRSVMKRRRIVANAVSRRDVPAEGGTEARSDRAACGGTGRSGAERSGARLRARLLRPSAAALRWRRAERCCGRWVLPPFCCPPCLAGRPDRRSAAASARWAVVGWRGAALVAWGGPSLGIPARGAFRAAILGLRAWRWAAARLTLRGCEWLRCARRPVVLSELH